MFYSPEFNTLPSAIYDGKSISFDRPVRYDFADNRLPPFILKIPPLPSALGNGGVYTSYPYE